MALFQSKGGSVLGVDVGSSSIKFVELEKSGNKVQLKTYSYINDISKVINEQSKDAITNIGKALKVMHQQSGAKSTQAIAALPNYSVFSSILTVPYTDQKEMESEVRKEAKKLIPKSINEMMIDWQTLDDGGKVHGGSDAEKFSVNTNKEEKGKESKEEKKPKFTKILLTATAKDLVKKYDQIFKVAGLDLVTLETEPLALTRSLLGKDPATVIFVDIGGLSTDVALVSEGVPLMSRSINVGGNIFTSAISRYTGLDKNLAEQFKIHMSYYPKAFVMPQVLKDAAAPTLNELKYTLELFRTRTKKVPEKIILTGEASLIPGLDRYFTEVLNVKVIIGDPFHRLSYPEGMDTLLDMTGSRFSVAIGLALRNFD